MFLLLLIALAFCNSRQPKEFNVAYKCVEILAAPSLFSEIENTEDRNEKKKKKNGMKNERLQSEKRREFADVIVGSNFHFLFIQLHK